jgi:hypothetical protein
VDILVGALPVSTEILIIRGTVDRIGFAGVVKTDQILCFNIIRGTGINPRHWSSFLSLEKAAQLNWAAS